MRLMIALLVLALGAAPALAVEKIRVSASISSNDTAATQKLAAALNAELAKATDFEVNDQLPQSKLILYANRDTGSPKNPNGWSIAFVHVSNVESYFLASKLMQSEQSDAASVKPMLSHMLAEQGFFKNLNVAHLEDLSDANVAAFAHIVIKTFLDSVPRPAKK